MEIMVTCFIAGVLTVPEVPLVNFTVPPNILKQCPRCGFTLNFFLFTLSPPWLQHPANDSQRHPHEFSLTNRGEWPGIVKR